MRNTATLTAAASVLAIGMATVGAAAFSPGAKVENTDGAVHKIQRGGEAPGARGGDGAGKSGGEMKGGDRGPGARSGEKAMGGDGPKSERSRVETDGDRGRRGDRAERRGRADVEVDRGRDRRRRVDRGFGIYVEPGLGYRPSCGWLRRRALDTGSRYWWRRYRACIGD